MMSENAQPARFARALSCFFETSWSGKMAACSRREGFGPVPDVFLPFLAFSGFRFSIPFAGIP